MGFYVITNGRDNITLFLVDRNKTKKHWWTMDLINAMEFHKESAANYSANRLRFKSPRVIDSKEAKRIESKNDFTCAMLEDHPFSTEALGQD